jgi:uncharacterized protein DUF922
MQKITTLLISLFILSISANAQKFDVAVNYVTTDGSHNPSRIFYDGKRNLNWDDFKATPCSDCIEAALTNSGMGFNFTFNSNGVKTTLVVNVYCDFDKSQSWVKPEGRNDYILKHEQEHYNISYICTMHFIDKLKNADITASNYNNVINKLYQESVQETKNMQDQYDTETNHSIIKDKQQEWNDKIDAEVQALKNN